MKYKEGERFVLSIKLWCSYVKQWTFNFKKVDLLFQKVDLSLQNSDLLFVMAVLSNLPNPLATGLCILINFQRNTLINNKHVQWICSLNDGCSIDTCVL